MGAKKRGGQQNGAGGKGGDATNDVSAPLVVHRTRSKRSWQQGDTETQRSLQALNIAWGAMQTDVKRALDAERRPALEALITAVRSKPPYGSLVCVCVLMGGGAVGGDRAAIFDGVAAHLERTHDVMRVGAGMGARALCDELRLRAQRRPTVVALDDADAASRDLLYVVADVAREVGVGSGSVALVVGCASDAGALHAACGQHEAAQVAVVAVRMPGGRSLLGTLVRQVLSRQTAGPLLERAAFELVEREFYERDTTLAMVLRTLKHAYTLHYMRQAEAAALAVPGDTLIENALDDEGADELRRWRHRRRTVEAMFWEVLRRTDAYQSGIEHRVGGRGVPHRVLMYKAFLPGATSTTSQPIVRIVLEEVARAQRHQLLAYAKVAADALEAHTVTDDEVVKQLVDGIQQACDSMRADGADPAAASPAGVGAEPKASTTPRAKGAGAAASRRRAALMGNAGASAAGNQQLAAGRQALREQLARAAAAAGCEAADRDAMVFGDVQALRGVTGGLGGAAEPRHSVLAALRAGGKEAPDIAVAYQILSEGGRLVNLYDWYNSFAALSGGENEVQLQARFARATAELEYLGLIKHTKRKADHVQRLVFE